MYSFAVRFIAVVQLCTPLNAQANEPFCMQSISDMYPMEPRLAAQVLNARRAATVEVAERLAQIRRNPEFNGFSDAILLSTARDRVRANLHPESIIHFDAAIREIDGLIGMNRLRYTSNGLAVVQTRQSTTRRPTLTLGTESFARDKVDFAGLDAHLVRHFGGAGGSQFNRTLFPNAEALGRFLRESLPENLTYDADGRVELTIRVETPGNLPVGQTGVISLAALRAENPGVPVTVGPRMPGGVEETLEVNGNRVTGSWYPETDRDGKPVEPPNPKFKFVPHANLASVPLANTNEITVIIQRDRTSGKPTVLTAFPGMNAPAQPARIERFGVETIDPTSTESQFWRDHVFLVPPR